MMAHACEARKSGISSMNAPIHTTLYELLKAVGDELLPEEQPLVGSIVLDLLAKSHCRIDQSGHPTHQELAA